MRESAGAGAGTFSGILKLGAGKCGAGAGQKSKILKYGAGNLGAGTGAGGRQF